MRTIKASELGSYLYCERAWGYQRNGVESSNEREMVAGTGDHQQHAAAVSSARLLRLAGWGFVLGALILLVIVVTRSFLV